MITTLAIPLNPTLEVREEDEKRYAIKCILDHYEALGIAESELFDRACLLWELELISLNMVLSICIDQLVDEFVKDH